MVHICSRYQDLGIWLCSFYLSCFLARLLLKSELRASYFLSSSSGKQPDLHWHEHSISFAFEVQVKSFKDDLKPKTAENNEQNDVITQCA